MTEWLNDSMTDRVGTWDAKHLKTQVVNTSCLINRKSRTKISMFLIQYENLPISFESAGYIDRNYTGRIIIKLTNYSSNRIKLNSGSPIGYIVMQPYSIG